MRPRRHPVRVALTLVVALLVTLVSTAGTTAQARAVKQRVYGAINCPKVAKCPNIKMLWFDRNWQYLGTQRANGGGYSLRLPAGSYHLQFVDQRPSWDTSKYAPTDIAVRVRSHTVSKSVAMKPGAAITGVARAGGKPLRGARVVAANKSEQSFTTTANKKGQFAVGGLPAGKYCLFTYDKARKYVDKCTWAGGVNFGQVKDQPVTLAKKAGNLTVFLDVQGGGNAPASTVTVTSRTTGQWWTAKARRGKAVLRGLYPGRYTIKYDGAGVWFTQSGAVHSGKVRPARMAFGDFTLTERGGWITGSLVDASAPTYALQPQGTQPGALVMLFAQDGTEARADHLGRGRQLHPHRAAPHPVGHDDRGRPERLVRRLHAGRPRLPVHPYRAVRLRGHRGPRGVRRRRAPSTGTPTSRTRRATRRQAVSRRAGPRRPSRPASR